MKTCIYNLLTKLEQINDDTHLLCRAVSGCHYKKLSVRNEVRIVIDLTGKSQRDASEKLKVPLLFHDKQTNYPKTEYQVMQQSAAS